MMIIISTSLFAKEELQATYSLDKTLISSKNCPQKITIEKKASNTIEMLVNKGDYSEGTSYGELKKYSTNEKIEKKDKTLVQVSSKLVTVHKLKKDKLIYKEVIAKKGATLIWQIDDKKKRKNSMNCFFK